jgi:hypothetical protein
MIVMMMMMTVIIILYIYIMYGCTGNNWRHRSSNRGFKEKFGSLSGGDHHWFKRSTEK